ncbi:hypothetical protein BDZ89DRAFT_458616 [Hymenopellis radicata]|nr:hypothetical protein BDZ89DRAFT_458616 [Hymenopellis radicata]
MSLTISSVCHHWRQIALEHPDLWSFIRVDAKTQRELVRLYLQRSKSRPLDLEISTSEPSLFEPLLDACRRWKVVHLACEYVHIGELCIFPMLTDLNIKAKRGSRLPSWSRPEQFPVLRKLRIDNSESISNFIDNAHLKIDWPRVSHVVGSPTSPMSFFSNKHLAAVPRVECICDSNPPAVDGNPSLHITSFVLCAPTWEFTGFLSKLPNFRLTRLDNLDLDIPANIPNIGSWFRIFAELLQRSECSITSLSLRRTRITDTEISLQVDDLYILFDACRSSLRCLTIMEGAPSLLTDDFVHNLLSVGHDGEPAYLPSLAQITLVWAERPRAKNYSIVAHSALARNLPLRIGSASTANGVKPSRKSSWAFVMA